MILPTREALDARRRGYQRRGVVAGVAFVLMIASCLAPHIAIRSAEGTFGRSLFPTSRFFLIANVQGEGFGGSTDPIATASALNIGYFGLSLQHIGVIFGVFTCWSLAAATLGRWTRLGLLVAGWAFAASAPIVILTYQLLWAGDIPADLGVGWLFSLLTGVVFLLGGRAAKDRLDTTWFWARPEWNG